MSVLEQAPLAMAQHHCRWLVDGRAFLAHVGDLGQIRLRAVCHRCVAAYALEPVRTSPDPDHQVVRFSCGHTAGTVKTDKPLDVAPLLLTLGWTLACTACGERVAGENDPTAARFTVVCPCTIREYRLPVA